MKRPLMLLALLGACACACAGTSTSENTNSVADTRPTATPPAVVAPEPAPPTQTAPGAPTPPASPTTPAVAKEPMAPPPTGPSSRGRDFTPNAQLMFRIAACGDDSPIPDRFDKKRVARHCKKMEKRYADYRTRWADKVRAFVNPLRPASLPKTVVYPFGGGDLSTALIVFPDATEITTVSLEAAGDPRPVHKLSARRLERDLKVVGGKIERLFREAHSSTKSLQAASHSELPGTVMFALAALAAHGYEPVEMRYFTLLANGDIAYLDDQHIAAAEKAFAAKKKDPRAWKKSRKKRDKRKPAAHKKRHSKLQIWLRQDAVFENMEIAFRRKGTSERRVYRHIVANLDNNHLGDDDRVIKHLARKGKVASMTKAASFLLWMEEFSIVRDYLLAHMVWMLSDATGVPPSLAKPAGFEQVAHGRFAAPWFRLVRRTRPNLVAEFVALWKTSTTKLGFRFGYPDAKGNGHMLITRKPGQN